jgi:membrane protein DedA with SNARE-associated domain
LASTGQFNLALVAICGTLGWLVGGIASYFLGKFGGRPLAEKYGKYILISRDDLDRSERWFQKYGEATIFFGQIIPVVRNFISLPSGIAKLNFKKFVIYTLSGAFLWSYFLSWIGFKLGVNWPSLKVYFAKLDWLVVVLIVAAIVLWLWRHLRKR